MRLVSIWLSKRGVALVLKIKKERGGFVPFRAAESSSGSLPQEEQKEKNKDSIPTGMNQTSLARVQLSKDKRIFSAVWNFIDRGEREIR